MLRYKLDSVGTVSIIKPANKNGYSFKMRNEKGCLKVSGEGYTDLLKLLRDAFGVNFKKAIKIT